MENRPAQVPMRRDTKKRLFHFTYGTEKNFKKEVILNWNFQR